MENESQSGKEIAMPPSPTNQIRVQFPRGAEWMKRGCEKQILLLLEK